MASTTCCSWVMSQHMRELIYLSERKLTQFRENGSPRRRWKRRVSELGATAPLGLGELQFTLADGPQRHPNLERVLRHLESLTPKPAEYFEASPDAGQWVKFKTRMNYQLVRPTTDGWSDEGEHIEHPAGPAAVVFWEPHSRLEPWSSAKPRLVLHGSPEHLLGLAATTPEPTDLSVSRSYPPGFMDLLYTATGPATVRIRVGHSVICCTSSMDVSRLMLLVFSPATRESRSGCRCHFPSAGVQQQCGLLWPALCTLNMQPPDLRLSPA